MDKFISCPEIQVNNLLWNYCKLKSLLIFVLPPRSFLFKNKNLSYCPTIFSILSLFWLVQGESILSWDTCFLTMIMFYCSQARFNISGMLSQHFKIERVYYPKKKKIERVYLTCPSIAISFPTLLSTFDANELNLLYSRLLCPCYLVFWCLCKFSVYFFLFSFSF